MSDGRQERDNEMLSAYLDGELSRAEADAMAKRLAREPDLAERLETLRSVDHAAVAAFRAVDERPIPARILDLIGEDEQDRHGDVSGTGNVVQLRKPAIVRLFQTPVAIAASVALVAGFFLSEMLGNGGDGESGAVYASRVPRDSDLHAVFDRGLSGEPVELQEGRIAEPVLTFRSTDGSYCRQVRITGAADPADTLACRRNGNWDVELVSFGGAASAAPGTPYGQASSGGAAAMRAAIDRVMGREPPLGRTEEAEIIGEGWESDGSAEGEAE